MSTYGKLQSKPETKPFAHRGRSTPEVAVRWRRAASALAPDLAPLQREPQSEEEESPEANEPLQREAVSSTVTAAGAPISPAAGSPPSAPASAQLDWQQLFDQAFARSKAGTRRAQRAALRERRWQKIDAIVTPAGQRTEASGVQTKLEVSEPGDALEREADQVADHVMRKPTSVPPTHPKTGTEISEPLDASDAVTSASGSVVAREPEKEQEEEETHRTEPMAATVQRACAECAATGPAASSSSGTPLASGTAQKPHAAPSRAVKGWLHEEDDDEEPMMMQRSAEAQTEALPSVQRELTSDSLSTQRDTDNPSPSLQRAADASPSTQRDDGGSGLDFRATLDSARAGGGEALPRAVRRVMEPRFGQDFGDVRIHRNAQASQLAETVHAKAFTVGRDLFFRRGTFQPASAPGQRLLAHELTHVLQQREGMTSVQRKILQRRDHDAAPVTMPSTQPSLQRAAMAPTESATGAQPPTPTEAAGGGFLVDDESKTLTHGQARKTQFIAELRAAVCAAADVELARAGRDTRGCPVIEKWLTEYRHRPASHLERAIRKFVRGASRVRSAREYIPLVAARVAQGVRTWVETGRIPDDLPPELRRAAMSGGLTGAISGTLSAIGGAVSSAVSAVGSALGGAVSAIGGLFFRQAPGGARFGADPGALMLRLGSGRPLEGAAKSSMERAFGQSFGDVRLHDDASAAKLSGELGAHAFTVGKHVAFSDGSFRPGTPVGDALLAHELAHVVQQSEPAPSSSAESEANTGPLERDADRAAADALAALYVPDRASPDRRPKRRSGLRLSRCGAAAQTQQPPQPEGQRRSIKSEKSGTTKETAKPEKAGEPGQAANVPQALHCGDPALLQALDSKAKEMLQRAWEETQKSGVEYCGHIIRAVGKTDLTTTGPVTQKIVDRCGEEITFNPATEQVVAFYHSHPRGPSMIGVPDCNADFTEQASQCFGGSSPGDRELACGNGLIYYLVNYEGEMKRYCPNLTIDPDQSLLRPVAHCQTPGQRGSTETIGRVTKP